MKKLFILIPLAATVSFSVHRSGLTDKEKEFAANHLQQSGNAVAESIKGLSEAQMNFKAAPDKWSVKECVYHIALAETNIWQWVQSIAQAPANPEKRADIKMSDEQVLAGLQDRSQKRKTFEPLEPKNAKWASVDEGLKAFQEERAKHIEYVKSTSDDLRNHVAVQTPLGALDSYQLVLFMSAHTLRHIKQIDEVKADPNFPKN